MFLCFYVLLVYVGSSFFIIVFDLVIECTLRQLRSEINSDLLGERPTETMDDDNPMVLRDHYLPTTYTSPACLRLPDVMESQYEIKPSIIQSLPSFLGLSTENLMWS
jgi:hypothetical protein